MWPVVSKGRPVRPVGGAKPAMIPCPNCNLTGYHRVVWGVRNLIALGFNLVFGLIQFAFLVWAESGIPNEAEVLLVRMYFLRREVSGSGFHRLRPLRL